MGKITKRSLAKEGSRTLSGGWSMFSWNKPLTTKKQPSNETPINPKETVKNKQREK